MYPAEKLMISSVGETLGQLEYPQVDRGVNWQKHVG